MGKFLSDKKMRYCLDQIVHFWLTCSDAYIKANMIPSQADRLLDIRREIAELPAAA